jgi:hypothetical protein
VCLLLLAGVLFVSSGNACEDGLREGIEVGTAEALAALIRVPVTRFLDQALPAE